MILFNRKIILLLLLVFIAGCFSNNDYNYSRLQGIAISLKTLYNDMKDIKNSSNPEITWQNKKQDLISRLDEIDIDVKALPKVEEPVVKDTDAAVKFNLKLLNAREILNKEKDILDLLYYANLSRNYSYYNEVVNDPYLDTRINKLIERCKVKGAHLKSKKAFLPYMPIYPPNSTDIIIEYPKQK